MSVTISPPRRPAKQGQGERLWTVEEFYRAYDTGEIDDSKRWELIQGRIIEKMLPGPRHSYLADVVAHSLRVALEPPLLVREEKAVSLTYDTLLMPDITVVRGARTDYASRHPLPDEVIILVEVADTSAAKDLGEKALQYTKAGITDYWVILVNEAVIVRHRLPSAEGYQEVVRLAGEDVLSPLAMPTAAWTVDALLGHGEG